MACFFLIVWGWPKVSCNLKQSWKNTSAYLRVYIYICLRCVFLSLTKIDLVFATGQWFAAHSRVFGVFHETSGRQLLQEAQDAWCYNGVINPRMFLGVSLVWDGLKQLICWTFCVSPATYFQGCAMPSNWLIAESWAMKHCPSLCQRSGNLPKTTWERSLGSVPSGTLRHCVWQLWST